MAIKPTFVGVGGMKCASTWVSACLSDHPEVLLSSPKETVYFLNRTGLEGYQRFFTGGGNYKAVGEITPLYLPNAPVVSKRIYATLGPVQILAILRNPVQRYISHYKWLLGRRDDLDTRTFSQLNLDNFARANSSVPSLLEYGEYRENLQIYIDRFGRDNVHIMIYEDIGKDALGVVRGLYEFLGVDSSVVPASLDQKVRQGYVPKYPALEWAKVKGYFLVKGAAPWAIDPLKKLGLEALLRRVNAVENEALVVAPEVYAALADYYAEDIEQMRALLGRPLNEWGGE